MDQNDLAKMELALLRSLFLIMDSFERFLGRVEALPKAHFVSAAAELLANENDLAQITSDFIDGQPLEALLESVNRAHVPNIQPRVFLLHEEPGRFQIVVNNFDTASYKQLWKAGRITPHYHHFSFATRILRGSYHHWIFKNGGNLSTPSLAMAKMAKCGAGDVYCLNFDTFHSVLFPAEHTTTLMIRGSQEIAGPALNRNRLELGYTIDSISKYRDLLVSLLRSAPLMNGNLMSAHDD